MMSTDEERSALVDCNTVAIAPYIDVVASYLRGPNKKASI